MGQLIAWKEFEKMSFSDKSDFKGAAHKALGLMVEHEERKAGSRDVAYENVANAIRMSSSWVKKSVLDADFMRKPRVTLFHNIKAAYERLCENIEAEHQAELKKLAKLKDEINAAADGIAEFVERENRSSVRGATSARPAPHPQAMTA